MKEIKEYMVIAEYGTNDLNSKVNEAIANGWQPFGGIESTFITLTQGARTGGGLMLIQAMVK